MNAVRTKIKWSFRRLLYLSLSNYFVNSLTELFIFRCTFRNISVTPITNCKIICLAEKKNKASIFYNVHIDNHGDCSLLLQTNPQRMRVQRDDCTESIQSVYIHDALFLSLL